MQHPQDMWKHS